MSVSEKLWFEWVPEHTRDLISEQISGSDIHSVVVLKFLSAVHDAGKAIPAFQRKPFPNVPELELLFSENLNTIGLRHDNKIADFRAIKHSIASEMILERNGMNVSLSSIIGSHHGSTPNKDDVSRLMINSYAANTGFEDVGWKTVQDSFFEYAVRISGASKDELRSVRISGEGQVLLSSLVILSDWIASNEVWFPLTDGEEMLEKELLSRVEYGWNSVMIPHQWHVSPGDYTDLFKRRFGKEPRPFQKNLIETVSKITAPGIFIIEAPMGEGKTEAALAASEILSERFGMGGVFFALPTQATSDGMFPRMKDWIDHATIDPEDVNSIFLAHGKSRFNEKYTSIRHIGWESSDTEGERTVIHEWFEGKKKGLLSDFAVGTVDHVLMGGLKMKHLALRHLALANKVIIIDECHAYDSYMGSYLEKAVEWLGSYHVPVIVMSATLFPSRRKELIEAYLGNDCSFIEDDEWMSSTSYPSITFTDGKSVKQYECEPSFPSKVINLERITDDKLDYVISDVSKCGGYIGIICNTVSRAQKIYAKICQTYPLESVCLLHSRFTCMDRSEKESQVLSLFSENNERQKSPHLMFIVGTQVIEQSLDLDFDVLITDLCPIDLLLQRIGRLHRHENPRPKGLELPTCYVIDREDGFESGSEHVYGRFQLYNTRILLQEKVTIPSDIPKLVHAAYSGNMLDIDERHQDDYLDSFAEMQQALQDREKMAEVFQICHPWSMKSMIGWLKNSACDNADGSLASATVRDTNGSVEVIMIKNNGDGTLSPISRKDSFLRIGIHDHITEDIMFQMAGSKIALPAKFASEKTIRHTIAELKKMTDENIPLSWRSNGWLKDELFIVTSPSNELSLNGTKMKYSFEEGLVIL